MLGAGLGPLTERRVLLPGVVVGGIVNEGETVEELQDGPGHGNSSNPRLRFISTRGGFPFDVDAG